MVKNKHQPKVINQLSDFICELAHHKKTKMKKLITLAIVVGISTVVLAQNYNIQLVFYYIILVVLLCSLLSGARASCAATGRLEQ